MVLAEGRSRKGKALRISGGLNGTGQEACVAAEIGSPDSRKPWPGLGPNAAVTLGGTTLAIRKNSIRYGTNGAGGQVQAEHDPDLPVTRQGNDHSL
jgi:hypothetical protein